MLLKLKNCLAYEFSQELATLHLIELFFADFTHKIHLKKLIEAEIFLNKYLQNFVKMVNLFES
jgi:hypothetical protein